ncbi:RICIN domain-containing protein [Streptomyces palmae]|uniref:Ricin B lectin domain-containing protein n=1 Tax=Streptomyces palmae TaxID=1701085 RepID=A0A4Z0HEB5_9ACTN|nr:RICIN domain-containing protein [Streptomyces palmae]TGB19612.1 hypothetical protein E4099_00230 [Streptomyces palmae]
MSRIAKTFVAVTAVAMAAVTTPAVGASTASSRPTPQADSGTMVKRLTPAELANLKSRAPEKFERMLKTIARSTRSAASDQAALKDPSVYQLVNKSSDKCLAIGSSSIEEGAHAIQWDCLDSFGQLWYSDNDRHIINFNSGKYLAIGSSSTANGAHAIQWDNTGSDGQRWALKTW